MSNPTAEKRLTMRDHFAIAALQGMLSSPPIVDRWKVEKLRWAEVAYDWADAMLTMRRGKKRGRR